MLTMPLTLAPTRVMLAGMPSSHDSGTRLVAKATLSEGF